MRQLFAREDFSPAWVSVSVLAWLGAAAALAGAALMWANVQTFGLVLEPDTVTHVVNGALTLVVAAAFFVFVGVLRAHLGQTGRVVWALLFVAVAAGSIVAPLAVRGRGAPPLLDAHPLDVAIDRRSRRAAGAGRHRRRRCRIARFHHQRHRQRTPAEFRAHSRCRRGDASGDHPPDVRRSRVGGGGDRETAAEERRALGRQLSVSRAAAIRSCCCPTIAFRTFWSGSAF